MPMSEAARAAAGERMRRMHAEGRMKKKEAVDPAVKEALAKAPITGVAPLPKLSTLISHDEGGPGIACNNPSLSSWEISILVDWEHLPMDAGQQAYAYLKSEFEKAGKILNARSMEHVSGYTCFMCHKHFSGNPGFTDYSYIDPATGLSPRVDCCGELCVINYHKHRIDMRLAKNIERAAQERGE